MRTRSLGRSGLQVSEIGLGCNNFGMRIGAEEAKAVVDAAIEAGINFFDTADMYGRAQSEVMLGQAIGDRRHQVIIATKFGMQVGKNPMAKGVSRRWIMQAVEDSLKRLGTDYIDLYQRHFPDGVTPTDETLRALDDLVAQGKVLYIGSSNMASWEVAEADWISRTQGLNRYVSAQNAFSLLDQRPLAELVPACDHFGIGILPYFPLASGLLSGKYRRGEPPPPGTRFGELGPNFADGMDDEKLARVEKLEAWAKARDRSLLELAFAWLLGHKAVSSVIAGATRPEQVRANAAASGWDLTREELDEVAKIARG